MRRERTSRPRLSVPRGKAGSAPPRQKGGSSVLRRFWSSGSCGATSDAATSAPRMAAPTQRRAAPDAAAMSVRSSPMADPRVEQHVAEVDGEVGEDEEDREGEDQALDEREVAIDHRADGEIADPGIAEDPLDEHGAAEEEGELHAREGHRRDKRVAQGLADEDV